MQSLTEQVQNRGGGAEKSRISRSPRGARLLSHSRDIVTTTPAVSSVDGLSTAGKTQARNTVLPLQTGSCFTKGGGVPECVNIYTALGKTMLLRQILLRQS